MSGEPAQVSFGAWRGVSLVGEAVTQASGLDVLVEEGPPGTVVLGSGHAGVCPPHPTSPPGGRGVGLVEALRVLLPFPPSPNLSPRGERGGLVEALQDSLPFPPHPTSPPRGEGWVY